MALRPSSQRDRDYRTITTHLKWAIPDNLPMISRSHRGTFIRNVASELTRHLRLIRSKIGEIQFCSQDEYQARINEIIPPVTLDLSVKFDKICKDFLEYLVSVVDEPQIAAAPPQARTRVAVLMMLTDSIREVLQSELDQHYDDRYSAQAYMSAKRRRIAAFAKRGPRRRTSPIQIQASR